MTEDSFTHSEENYLKAIFHLQHAFPNGVSTNSLAVEIKSKASSVSDMLRKLSEKKLVKYKKYQGVKLSEKGKNAAVEVIRRHRLWEVFLVEKLNFSWDEVHSVAEQLEHVKSEKLTRELDGFLDFPRRDPHGDPIPDAQGNFVVSNQLLLSELEINQVGLLVGVRDSSSEFLQFLTNRKLILGMKISVREKEAFDGSMLIKTNTNELQISQQVSNNLFIKLL
ncbi:MAG TPA: metal-dependent transcriptional regulator [Salinimicrobium sp.]|nr:metal-dependent transcriptional regulator [Salinimicrobium sp.]